MTRLIYFLLLILVFEFSQMEAKECDPTPSKVNAIDDTESTLVLTQDVCIDGRKSAYLGDLCCSSFVPNDDEMVACEAETQDIDDQDDLTQFAILTECYYKAKNYIKGNRELNFDQISADAAKLESQVKHVSMLEMFYYCACAAKQSLQKLNMKVLSNPQKLKWRLELKKPYFYYVFTCVAAYPITHRCAFFQYASSEEDTDLKCENYADQCEEILK